ncbi:MAG: M35 family metallo-endopeptidase [Candidatus Thiodiazotropha sp.]
MPLQMDPSCNTLNSLQKHEIRSLYDRASALLTLAHTAIMRIGFDESEQQRFSRWFGTYSKASMVPMKQNIHDLHNALVTQNCFITWCHDGALPNGQVAPHTANAAVFKHQSQLQIYIFPHFFTQGLNGMVSEAGTIIHELSHCVLSTRDHCYRQAACQELARSNPLFARANADSYRMYCEEFQNRVPWR